MGNVSYVVPSIHPMIAAAPLGTPIHTTDFAAAARSSSGDAAVVDGAVAMAWTVADLWLGEGVLAAARSEHEASLARVRSEEHTSELQSLMRNSYAVFCLKQKKQT